MARVDSNFTRKSELIFVSDAANVPNRRWNDNDTAVVTDDGTHTGTVEEMYKFNSETDGWVKISFGGGTSCPAPMTRAALVALRNSSQLSRDCHYVITDYNRGTVGSATIMLHAVDENTLAMGAFIKVSFDNTAWQGRYDIDTNRIVELNDANGNKVSGQEIVDTFPWGTANVYDNIIEEGAKFTFVSGRFYDNRIQGDATVTVNAGTVARNRFDQYSNTTVNGGSFYENDIHSDATVTWNTSNCYGNEFGNESVLNDAGSRQFYRNELSRAANVTTGDLDIYDNEFRRSTVNFTGSVGAVRYCGWYDCTSFVNAKDINRLDIAYCKFYDNSQFQCNGAARVYLRYFHLKNYGRLLVSAGKSFDGNYTTLADYAYAYVQGGHLYCNYSTYRDVTYIQQLATVTGTNRAERNHMVAQSRIRFTGTVEDCRIYYCRGSAGAIIEHRGTSKGSYIYYYTADASSQVYTNNSDDARMYYGSNSGRGISFSQGCTGVHYMYYCAAIASGYVIMNGGFGGRMYAILATTQGRAELRNSAPGSNWYYSTVSDYYYLYLTLVAATRYGLNAAGRRTYSVTNPPNGTYQQNF